VRQLLLVSDKSRDLYDVPAEKDAERTLLLELGFDPTTRNLFKLHRVHIVQQTSVGQVHVRT
jgi:hypothetical protein